MEGLGLALGLSFFYFIMNLDPWCNMRCDFTWTENIWGGNVRWTPSKRQPHKMVK